MKTIDTLILLISSLSKAEKKNFSLFASGTDYYILYTIIAQNQTLDSTAIRRIYESELPHSNFNVNASYLYTKLLDSLLFLEANKNYELQLTHDIYKADILVKKSLFQEAIAIYREVQEKAKKAGLDFIYTQALQAEVQTLLSLNFHGVSEKELSEKHFQITETLNCISNENKLSILYHLLKHRVLNQDIMRNAQQENSLNDLLLTEMSLKSSIGRFASFNASKYHHLFQSTYLLSTNNFKASLHSLKDLMMLFEKHPEEWSNHPFYYILAIENALYHLRNTREYASIPYFLQKLEKLNTSSRESKALSTTLILLYTLYPMIDQGLFSEASLLLNKNKEVKNIISLLNTDKQAEVIFTKALIAFGTHAYSNVKRLLNPIVFQTKHFYYLPQFKAIRLLHLMSLYELNQLDSYEFELRAFKREIAKNKYSYKVESLLLRFLKRKPVYFNKREQEWEKYKAPIEAIRSDIYEQQILHLFDFTKWIESKIRNIPLTQLLHKDN